MHTEKQLERWLKPRFYDHADGGRFVRLPGFRFTDFTTAGLPSLVSINRMLLLATARWNVKDLANCENVFFVYVGYQLKISERLYERARIDFPMTLRWSVVGVGKSSFDQCMVLNEDNETDTLTSSHDGGKRTQSSNTVDPPLATCVTRRVTRDKTPMSEQLHDDLSSSLVADGKRLPTIRLPQAKTADQATFTHRVKVRGDDTDTLGHVNASSYVGFSMECARIAVKSGFYSSIRDDVNLYRVKSVTNLYKAESLVDDELDVTTWEENDNSRLLNFVINKQGKLIYSSQVEFYDRFLDRSHL